jgi:SAM-dependent methyltransferase
LSPEAEITSADIARLAGAGLADVAAATAGRDLPALRYRRLSMAERDAAILRAITQLSRTDLIAAGANDASRWERGWAEILDRVRARGVAVEHLLPQYFQHEVLRYDGDYIRIDRADFEYQLYDIFRRVIFPRHLTGFRRIVDIGCGTGASLLTLADLFPDAELVGCDWARPSQELVSLIAAQLRRPMRGVRFNMLTLEGRDDLAVDRETAVITLHAMEQLGSGFVPMLDYLLSARPGICLHIEPIAELYDPDLLFDWLALRYHEKRNYLSGFLSALRAKEAEGALAIHDVRRLRFGSAFHEGYSLVVWTPRA